MKNYILLLICLVLLSCGQQKQETANQKLDADSSGQQQTHAAPDSTNTAPYPTTVAAIKTAYASINNQLQRGLLDSVTLKYDCAGERSGTITYYSANGKLAIVKHAYHEYDHFSATDTYFVDRGQLYFAYLHHVTWSFVDGSAAAAITNDAITEQRFYMAHQKPLLCLEKKYNQRSDAAEKPRPAHIQNSTVECKTIRPLSKDLERLLAFKAKPANCLTKTK